MRSSSPTPTTSADDLVPWLKTVVKHEAFALRMQRERHGVPTEHDDSTPADADTHEHVERLDQLQRGAEALQRLKPHETRCLLLLAEGVGRHHKCDPSARYLRPRYERRRDLFATKLSALG